MDLGLDLGSQTLAFLGYRVWKLMHYSGHGGCRGKARVLGGVGNEGVGNRDSNKFICCISYGVSCLHCLQATRKFS